MQHFSFIFLHENDLTVPNKIVCVVMIHHDQTWFCPRRTRLYINYLGKVYEENEWRKHFRNVSCDVTAQLYSWQTGEVITCDL